MSCARANENAFNACTGVHCTGVQTRICTRNFVYRYKYERTSTKQRNVVAAHKMSYYSLLFFFNRSTMRMDLKL